MIKPSNLVFRDSKNIKRTSTVLSHSTSKDIAMSAKDIRNSRSTKQIDVTNFMENKNQKIKNIDEKLEVHQSEISKNNHIIEELNNNFYNLKEHLSREKEVTANEERKNRLLREEIERTNKILRTKNSRIQEQSKKIGDIEKDNQNLKSMIGKYDEYTKTINSLRSKVANYEQNMSDLKNTISERERELHRQKDKVNHFDVLKGREEDLNGQILMKDMTIGNLRQTINELHQQKSKHSSQVNVLECKIENLTSQIDILKISHKTLNGTISNKESRYLQLEQKCEQLESQLRKEDGKLKDKEREGGELRKEHNQLKQKLFKVEGESQQLSKLVSKREVKIQKLTQKIKELEGNCGDNMKQRQKLKHFQQRFSQLKKKGQVLQNVYYSIIPQIQCPFGHELNNPVTIIPCGHNYCLGCKKGYMKECMQCCGKLKIEAVYRNQLMDDIMGMVGGIRQVIDLIK